MRLKRGPIILIAGGAATIASFAVYAYLLTENTYIVNPNDHLTIERFVSNNNSQVIYAITFPSFEGQPGLKIVNPANQTVIDDTIDSSFISETFTATDSGYYTLTLTNPSDATLEAYILFGDRESFASGGQLASSLILPVGITAAIAGAVITILDRRRANKMKQFGDTSDLV